MVPNATNAKIKPILSAVDNFLSRRRIIPASANRLQEREPVPLFQYPRLSIPIRLPVQTGNVVYPIILLEWHGTAHPSFGRYQQWVLYLLSHQMKLDLARIQLV